MKYIAPILFLLIACNTARQSVTVYDTIHKQVIEYDTVVKTKDSIELRIRKKDSIVTVPKYYDVPTPVIKYYDSLVIVNDTTFNRIDSTIYNFIYKAVPKDTPITIPIYINPAMQKYIKSGELKYTIQYK